MASKSRCSLVNLKPSSLSSSQLNAVSTCNHHSHYIVRTSYLGSLDVFSFFWSLDPSSHAVAVRKTSEICALFCIVLGFFIYRSVHTSTGSSDRSIYSIGP